MRFVIAIVLFVVSLATMGLGVAQRTILLGPATVTEQITTADAPVTVVSSDALRAFDGTQRVTISGSKKVFLAYGRTADVLAWVGDARHNVVRFDVDTQKLISRASGTEKTVPSPAGSDLWLQEYEGSNELTRSINPPAGISLIVLSDGKKAAPSTVSITWPLDQSAPASGPLILAGVIALLLGLLALLWALVHARRRRGPRRSARAARPLSQRQLVRRRARGQLPPAPVRKVLLPGHSETDASDAPREPEVGKSKGRTKRGRGKRGSVAAGVLLVASLALAGCTTTGTSGATPTPTGTAAANQVPPVVTEPQLKQILDKVRATVDDADAAKDPDLASDRLAGPALADRTANYKITTNDPAQAAIAPIPNGTLKIVLPEHRKTWPRTVFAVVIPPDEATAPVALVLKQDRPRANYKVHYVMSLKPETVLPELAPATIGASNLSPDNALGVLPPNELAKAYGDVLAVDKDSAWASKFDADGDTLRTAIGAANKAARIAALPPTAKIAFSHSTSSEPPVSFPTLDSGQLVAVALNDTETVTPVETGAAINTPALVKALSGLGQSTKGITATYGLQLLFYVPSSEKKTPITLLGYTQGLISASEVP